MSAIFGLVHFDDALVNYADLARMDAALRRHGADGGGLWREGGAGLGQRLLQLTPQDAHERQPLRSNDGALVLVSDARLDNRAELLGDWRLEIGERRAGSPRANLQSLLSNLPDSALILQAYRIWGIECVRHLTGVFAFAVWDTRTRTLFAARSPIAAPSLFYTATPRVIAFATMPSGLHALPFAPRSLDETGLARLLTGLGGDDTTTLYRTIRRLPTGHRLIADRRGMHTENYWQPDLTHTLHLGSDADYLDAFNDLFTRIVSDHLVSTTPIALQLSGGLDSSAVAAASAPLLAARSERLTAFTEAPRTGFAGAMPRGFYADETPFVQAIAAMTPALDLHLMRTDGQTFLQGMDDLFATLEMPFQNTSNRVWIEAILAETSRRGLRVLLDGAQGNLTLSWHGGGWLTELLHAGQWSQAAQQVQALARVRGVRPALRSLIGQGLLPLLPDPAWLTVQRVRHLRQPAADAWRTMTVINPVFAVRQGVPKLARLDNASLPSRARRNSRRVRYEALAMQDFGAYISAYRARFGVDMRSPTADVRLAEFCLALPEAQFWRDGESRSLVRRAFAGRLPPAVLSNRQRGMQAADWFERLVGANAQVNAELARLEQSDLARRVLDLPRMRQLWEQLPAGSSGKLADYAAYQGVLQRGLMVGAFLCWFEAGG
jgi:asparagine synthase (glutamine-hydrolysing)